jgi:tRNA nucleotidyltransferase (CCA-adding enzyme)
MTLSNHYLPDVAEIERTHAVRDSVLALVRSIMAENRIEGKVLAVGSTAKDTFVKGDTDIDIFIVSPNYKEAYSLFKRKISGHRKEGPMDIWHFIFKDYDVDLVFIPPDHPRIDTLLHTEFMNQNLTPELKKEVIRAKAFFKSSGVYGAEIGGIVGVAIEELIRRHGNLEKVCTVLLSSSDIPFIPDPAKPERNLLASIKKIRWKQIQTVCDDFLKSRTFKYRPYTKTEYLADRHEWNHIHFQRKRDRPTDFHSALSVCNHALNEVKNREPEVKGTCDAYVFDEVLISYDVTPKQLPRQKLHCGPPLEMHESVRAFKTIYPETFEKDGKVCTLIERERTDVVEWMKDLITDRMQNIGYKVNLNGYNI